MNHGFKAVVPDKDILKATFSLLIKEVLGSPSSG